MYIVILAGGSGTRFWPLSRKKHPKQLMSVFGGKSMLQRTVERVLPLKPKRILVVTNTVQARQTREQLQYLSGVPIDIIEEPIGRNTAPAIGLAAAVIGRHDADALMVVLPADHYITDEESFCATIGRARGAALNGFLVTLGITPDRPETGYGYIEADRRMRGEGPYPVVRFVEKPSLERALEFLESGNFYWNSGMFIWQVRVILEQMETHMPELYSSLEMLRFSDDIWELADLNPQIAVIYDTIRGESIDYGVMEKAKDVEVIPADFGWSDVGSWRALPEVLDADDDGNLIINANGSVSIDSRNCLAYGGGKMVAFVGVDDLIVVDTGDAVMVCKSDRAQDVKKVVEELERTGRVEYL